MKKILLIMAIFSFACVCSSAENLKGSISGSAYADYMEKINLTESQKEQINNINKEEEYVLKPYVLDIESKEIGIDYLKSTKCGFFEKKCRKLLKNDIQQRRMEEAEALRKIEVKKNYYDIRYRNTLTRSQDHQIQEMVQRDALIEKVSKERKKRAKAQAKKEKMKFWKKKN